MVRTIFKEANEARVHARCQAYLGYALIGLAGVLFVYWFLIWKGPAGILPAGPFFLYLNPI